MGKKPHNFGFVFGSSSVNVGFGSGSCTFFYFQIWVQFSSWQNLGSVQVVLAGCLVMISVRVKVRTADRRQRRLVSIIVCPLDRK